MVQFIHFICALFNNTDVETFLEIFECFIVSSGFGSTRFEGFKWHLFHVHKTLEQNFLPIEYKKWVCRIKPRLFRP